MFTPACEEMCWNHVKPTPYRLETNGSTENAVRRVKEGTSVLVVQSGLSEKWWEEAMHCFCLGETWKTNWQTETVMPFGAAF